MLWTLLCSFPTTQIAKNSHELCPLRTSQKGIGKHHCMGIISNLNKILKRKKEKKNHIFPNNHKECWVETTAPRIQNLILFTPFLKQEMVFIKKITFVVPFTLRIGFNINELLNLKYIEIVQVNSRTVCVQHPNNPFVFGSFHLYFVQIMFKSLDWFPKKECLLCMPCKKTFIL